MAPVFASPMPLIPCGRKGLYPSLDGSAEAPWARKNQARFIGPLPGLKVSKYCWPTIQMPSNQASGDKPSLLGLSIQKKGGLSIPVRPNFQSTGALGRTSAGSPGWRCAYASASGARSAPLDRSSWKPSCEKFGVNATVAWYIATPSSWAMLVSSDPLWVGITPLTQPQAAGSPQPTSIHSVSGFHIASPAMYFTFVMTRMLVSSPS